MATHFKALNDKLREFILAQQMFFVATAASDGFVNVSPKGLDSLHIVSDNNVKWLNLSGSGNETAAHVLETPRMTLMFCAFNGPARILRVFGTARTIHPADADWKTVVADFPVMAGARQVFDLEIEHVSSACGTGVPVMDFVKQRGPEELLPYYENLGPEGVQAYWNRKNKVSLNGKPTGI